MTSNTLDRHHRRRRHLIEAVRARSWPRDERDVEEEERERRRVLVEVAKEMHLWSSLIVEVAAARELVFLVGFSP